jgi:hypothetical protein
MLKEAFITVDTTNSTVSFAFEHGKGSESGSAVAGRHGIGDALTRVLDVIRAHGEYSYRIEWVETKVTAVEYVARKLKELIDNADVDELTAYAQNMLGIEVLNSDDDLIAWKPTAEYCGGLD